MGGGGGHFFRLACSVVLWGGRNTANKHHWRVWGVLAVSRLHWVCPRSRCVCFHGLHFSGSRLLCWELSEAGPGLCTLSRSKPLRFRFSGIPQRRRLSGPAFCALPRSEQLRWPGVWQAQSPPGRGCILSPPPSQLLGFLGVQWAHLLRGAVCLFWELISGCDPPSGC